MIIKSICLAVGLSMLFACSKSDEKTEPETESEIKQELLVKSNMVTYANEKVYIWGDKTNGNDVQAHFNVWFLTADAKTALTSETKNYFPSKEEGLNMYAVHGNLSSIFVSETTPFPVSPIIHNVKSLQI